MRRSDARSREIERPDGVADSFQISENKVEPILPVLARNLFTKESCRSALSDEWKPRRPKMARIVGTFTASRHAPRLAWATPGPTLPIIRPSGESERVGPSSDAGEEVTLPESSEVVGPNIGN